MTNVTRKQVVDIFCEKLEANFQQYCAEHGLPVHIGSFTTYLIDQELIDGNVIRHYAILELFKDLYPVNEHQKTQTVRILAKRFNLSARTIWNVLRKQGK